MERISVKSQERHTPENRMDTTEPDLATDTVHIPIKLCNLRPLNAVANQVLSLSADPNVDLRQLSDVMRRDPAFGADVLFLANSSLFGFPQRMHSLRHALAILGLDRIRALAVTVAMRGFVSQGGPLIRQCWQHSAACAVICEEIAPIFRVTSDVAYTAGLMHDIGLLGFLKSYPNETAAVLNSAFDDVDQALAAERALLNVDHTRAGAWLAKGWAFPSTFAECCERHHDPFTTRDSELVSTVKVGCRIADALGFSAFRLTNVPGYDEVLRSFSTDVARFPPAAELQASVEAKLALF